MATLFRRTIFVNWSYCRHMGCRGAHSKKGSKEHWGACPPGRKLHVKETWRGIGDRSSLSLANKSWLSCIPFPAVGQPCSLSVFDRSRRSHVTSHSHVTNPSTGCEPEQELGGDERILVMRKSLLEENMGWMNRTNQKRGQIVGKSKAASWLEVGFQTNK